MRRESLEREIGEELAELQGAYDDSDRALANRLGIGRTDLRCLDLIVRSGPCSATEVARKLGLTRGSVTTLIDRLERAGYATRRPDPAHGKRVLVVPTPRLIELVEPLVEPRARAGREQLAAYSVGELLLIRTFLRQTRERHSEYAEDLSRD
jgi:DNA-binding MarR family transcriptional regulator